MSLKICVDPNCFTTDAAGRLQLHTASAWPYACDTSKGGNVYCTPEGVKTDPPYLSKVVENAINDPNPHFIGPGNSLCMANIQVTLDNSQGCYDAEYFYTLGARVSARANGADAEWNATYTEKRNAVALTTNGVFFEAWPPGQLPAVSGVHTLITTHGLLVPAGTVGTVELQICINNNGAASIQAEFMSQSINGMLQSIHP